MIVVKTLNKNSALVPGNKLGMRLLFIPILFLFLH